MAVRYGQSLVEREYSLRKMLDDEPFELGALYDFLYRRVFGKRSWRKTDNASTNAMLGQVYSWCLREEVDPATYIIANMHGLRDWISRSYRRNGFQVNMLVGENAAKRYNYFVHKANRRKRGLADALPRVTKLGVLRETLYLDEATVGEHYVRSALVDPGVTWEAAVSDCTVSNDWTQFKERRGDTYYEFRELYGNRRTDRELELMALAAAISVVNCCVHYDAATWVGCSTFSWPSLVELLRLLPAHTPRAVFSPEIHKLGTLVGVA